LVFRDFVIRPAYVQLRLRPVRELLRVIAVAVCQSSVMCVILRRITITVWTWVSAGVAPPVRLAVQWRTSWSAATISSWFSCRHHDAYTNTNSS